MGHCLVVYDITHDRTRTKVAETCLDYGLDRIQYSAFLGILARTHQEELMQKLERQLGKHKGSIQLYPICRKDWAQRAVIEVRGKEPDGKLADAQADHSSELPLNPVPTTVGRKAHGGEELALPPAEPDEPPLPF